MATEEGEFRGQVLDGGQIENWFRRAIAYRMDNLILCSAYIRSEALRCLFSEGMSATGKVLVRWRLEDLAFGASDLSVFDECQRIGLKLFMRLDFHGKAYAVPGAGISIGSANLTLSGLGLHQHSNAELGTIIDYNQSNVDALEILFSGAKPVDQDLVDQLKKFLPESPKEPDLQWPVQILKILDLNQARHRLFVDECFWSDRLLDACFAWDKLKPNQIHDLQILGLNAPPSPEHLKVRFKLSPMFRWLTSYLSTCPEKQDYFGGISSKLHGALICDPSPWRSTVKQLLQNILFLVQELGVEEVAIDRPRHSQRVRLVDSI